MESKTCEEYVLAELAKALAENEQLKTRTTDVIEDGEAKPYGTWCMESMEVHGFPSSIDKTEFMAFFEPEFREAYEERLEEER